ncbi:uncharacterized protein LOC142972619 [Anticarsia gemmatalis]|uniref:uncharacterized protein LOC142972619 n=1 Tax=Anticarsia gemmatalis TaxID=129554 RepID=UPI003F766996
MAKYLVALALLGCAAAEPPVGYSYSAPSHHHSSSSIIAIGGISGGSGHYTSVPVGHQTSEGYHVDPHLLSKIKHIILKDEIQNQAYSGGHGHGSHGISSHYGPPAPVYGVPHDRIVGIELDHIQQAIQVAQYHQAEEGYATGYAGGYSGYSSGGHGFSSGGHGFGGHGHGHSTFTTIGVPSGSYGVPPSSSYGVPH